MDGKRDGHLDSERMTVRRSVVLSALAVISCLSGSLGHAHATPHAAEPVDSTLARATRLFEIGRFDRAAAVIAEAPARDPGVARLRGRLSLLANRTGDAERWLKRVVAKDATDSTALAWLAETYYRRDRFAEAAELQRRLGHDAMARKLESFGRETPYRLIRGDDSTAVPFIQTDPLPAIEARVDDGS